MIQPSPELSEFELRYARERGRSMTFQNALNIFTALWVEASALNTGFPGSWEEDIEPDLAVARAVNGLPPLLTSASSWRDSQRGSVSGIFRSCSSVDRRSCSTASLG